MGRRYPTIGHSFLPSPGRVEAARLKDRSGTEGLSWCRREPMFHGDLLPNETDHCSWCSWHVCRLLQWISRCGTACQVLLQCIPGYRRVGSLRADSFPVAHQPSHTYAERPCHWANGQRAGRGGDRYAMRLVFLMKAMESG